MPLKVTSMCSLNYSPYSLFISLVTLKLAKCPQYIKMQSTHFRYIFILMDLGDLGLFEIIDFLPRL